MALNIKNKDVERLAAEVSEMTGESETEAIFQALEERKAKLRLANSKTERLRAFLESEVWPDIPSDLRGKPISQEEQDATLGYGPDSIFGGNGP